MMWLKEWLEYAQTKSGGMHSDDQAMARWNEWLQELSIDIQYHKTCLEIAGATQGEQAGKDFSVQ